jgi:3-phosphoshikimate 1-carboxyvinyltransferase
MVNVAGNEVTVSMTELNSFTFDATDSPDLFPPLAARAAYCKGTSTIKGVHRLVTKESDRSRAITDVLQALNIHAVTDGDEMIIEGGDVRGACVSSYNDHRIVMMAAIAGIKSTGKVTITGAEAVSKSFPEFFDTLAHLGIVITR